MKQRLSKFLALALVLALFAGLLAPAASASWALGTELHDSTMVLGDGVTLTTQSLWSATYSDLRTERYLTYIPTGTVTPTVIYGDTLMSKGGLTKFAQRLEAEGRRVLGGVNGDYFVVATGEPLGSLVTDGVLRSGSIYYPAIGFKADGAVLMGEPRLHFWADVHGYHFIVEGGYNKAQKVGQGYAFYSPEYGATVGRSGAGVDVILRPVEVPEDYEPPMPEEEVPPAETELPPEEAAPEGPSEADGSGELDPSGEPEDAGTAEPEGPSAQEIYEAALADSVKDFVTLPAQMTVGGSVTCVVEAVVPNAVKTQIPAGRFVLSLAEGNPEYMSRELLALKVGERVTLSVTTEYEEWQEAVTIQGAFQQIVKDGALVPGLDTSMAPRTAAGLRADGTLILYTMDGRKTGYSVGAGVDQIAKRLLELECVEGVLLDGGGSTTLGVTEPWSDTFGVQNQPSDGRERAVSNVLLLVSDLEPTGEPGSLYIAPHGGVMLSGAKLDLTGYAVDTGYYPLGRREDIVWSAEGAGRVEENTLIAGSERGGLFVRGETPEGSGGDAKFTVIDTPTTINLMNEETSRKVTALSVEPGAEVQLTASAVWYNLPVICQDTSFTWLASPAVGTVDEEGTFTAGYDAGTGVLTVSAGARLLSVPVTVGGHLTLLQTCDDLMGFLNGTAQLSPAQTAPYVKFGRGSLRVTYPTDAPSAFSANLTIPAGETRLGMWVYGDNTPVAMTALLEREDGTGAEVTVLDGEPFEGWKQFFVPIPADTARLVGFALTPGENAGGKLYLDQLITSNMESRDTLAPTVQVSVVDNRVIGAVSDDVDRSFTKKQVTVTLDGVAIPFELEEEGGVTAALPAPDGNLHRVSIQAWDVSGNLSRATVTVEPAPLGEDEEPHVSPFVDTGTHWARTEIEYLYQQGLLHGVETPAGMAYQPGREMTRLEFAVLAARWLRCDLSEYSAITLPFADVSQIPAWAQPEMKAVYALGFFTGSLEAGGRYAYPNRPITRAEAMTLLGRIQSKGWTAQEKPFPDDEAIPAWARDFVYSLAGQGIVSGDERGVRPNDPITRAEVAKLFTALW